MGIRHGDVVTSLLRQEHIIDPLVRRKILLEAVEGLHGGQVHGRVDGKPNLANRWGLIILPSKHLEISLSLVNQPCMYFIFVPTLLKNKLIKLFGVTSKRTFAVEGKTPLLNIAFLHLVIYSQKYPKISCQITSPWGGSIVTRVSLF